MTGLAARLSAGLLVAALLGGGLLLWRDHGLAVVLSNPAWMCVPL
ncbi:MAG TPA: hypothetical protein VK943_09815 [Arenibaculum sp.]|nr:hypothetical protein [Arenibaculum sp.]